MKMCWPSRKAGARSISSLMFLVAFAYAWWPKNRAALRSRPRKSRSRTRTTDVDKKEVDEVSGTETTGHEWDGIKELNTPLPRWWLGIFYATHRLGDRLLDRLSRPGRHSAAIPMACFNHSQRDDVTANVAALKAARAPPRNRRCATPAWPTSRRNPDLLQFAHGRRQGRCSATIASPCHGAGGQGAHGYPNLNDDVWLWGGKLDDIQHTITVGVRSTSSRHAPVADAGLRARRHPEAGADRRSDRICRSSLRPACGRGSRSRRATKLFAENCAACHGPEGKGNRRLGRAQSDRQ